MCLLAALEEPGTKKPDDIKLVSPTARVYSNSGNSVHFNISVKWEILVLLEYVKTLLDREFVASHTVFWR